MLTTRVYHPFSAAFRLARTLALAAEVWREALFQAHPSPQPQPLDRQALNAQAERLLDHYGNSVLRLAYSYLHNMAGRRGDPSGKPDPLFKHCADAGKRAP